MSCQMFMLKTIVLIDLVDCYYRQMDHCLLLLASRQLHSVTFTLPIFLRSSIAWINKVNSDFLSSYNTVDI